MDPGSDLVGTEVTFEPATNSERSAIAAARVRGARWIVHRVAAVEAGRLKGVRCAFVRALIPGTTVCVDWRWVPVDRLTVIPS